MTAVNPMASGVLGDEALVAASLSGDRDAFGHIVARYQSLVCAMAYNATGSLSQSEDLAQDTFVAAWKHLPKLREPSRLRPWLCGIARNLIHSCLRQRARQPINAAKTLDEVSESPSRDPLPVEQLISREEEALLWRSIERIPEVYREPLVLFYREHKSAVRVGEILDLSEEAVNQRLSRGRKLLHEHVLAFVEGALERTQPGRGFTQHVVAVLPLLTSGTTSGVAAHNTLQFLKGALKAMAWTKTKTAIVLGAVAIVGTTTTLVGLKLVLPYWAENFATTGLSPTKMIELYTVAADGSVHMRTTIEETNLTATVVRNEVIGDLSADSEIADESGKPMKFRKQRSHGYLVTLNRPVPSGEKVSYTISGNMGRLFKANQFGDYEFEITQQQGNVDDMRLVETWRLPVGATLVESSPAEMALSTNSNGQLELRLEKIVPPMGETPLIFRYRLSEGIN